MTGQQILAGVLISILFTARPFAYRLISRKYSTKTSSLCIGTWLIMAVIFTLPFFYHLLFLPTGGLYFKNPVLILSMFKGVSLWFLIKNQQLVNRENISASVFFTPIGTGLGVIANRFFFNERLTQTQFLAILGLSLLGMLFSTTGSAKTLNKKNKIRLVILIIFLAMFMCIDQIVISRTNWYVHIMMSSIAFFLTSFFSHSKMIDWKNALFHRDSIIAGSVYVVGEFYLLSVMIKVIPVSIAILFVRLTIPFVMGISSILYKEGKWHEQLLFGCCALGLCLPLIFR